MSYKRDKKYYKSREAFNEAHKAENKRYYAQTPVERAQNGNTKWTRDDINVLTHWASDDLSLANFLGRTLAAVQIKRHKLKEKGY